MARARLFGAAALTAALVLPAGCSAGGEADADPPASEPTSAATSVAGGRGGATVRPAVDPLHAVEPPGPREGALAPADILVTSGETISSDTVDAIRGLRGVLDVEVLSIASVTIENEAV